MKADDQADTLDLFRDSVRRFLAAHYTPHLSEWRREAGVPRGFFASAGQQGLLCPSVPECYGGPGGDYRYNVVVTEEVARCTVTPASFIVHSDICTNYILRWGSEQQKRELLPAMACGDMWAAIAMTEPEAGSDLQSMRTTAVRVEGGYAISGRKTFITNGRNCDLIVVAAKTDPSLGARGISLFLVDAATPGFERGRRLEKMGGHEQDTAELFFDNVFVPQSRRLGEEGQGFAILMAELPTERLSLSISAVAAAETAFDLTVSYVKERQAFGRHLIEFQNTAFKLAELRAQMRMARSHVNHCIELLLQERLTAVAAAEAKLVTTALQCRVVDECLQLFGGYGWMDEYPISRMYTDARVQRIYGGTDEIMKLIISRDL